MISQLKKPNVCCNIRSSVYLKIYSDSVITKEISSFTHASTGAPLVSGNCFILVQKFFFQLQLLLLLALGHKLQSMAEYSKPGWWRINLKGVGAGGENDLTISLTMAIFWFLMRKVTLIQPHQGRPWGTRDPADCYICHRTPCTRPQILAPANWENILTSKGWNCALDWWQLNIWILCRSCFSSRNCEAKELSEMIPQKLNFWISPWKENPHEPGSWMPARGCGAHTSVGCNFE